MPKISDPIIIRNVELKNRLYAPPLLSGKILILSCNYWIFYVLWHNFSFSI
jgi:hypothetical protein